MESQRAESLVGGATELRSTGSQADIGEADTPKMPERKCRGCRKVAHFGTNERRSVSIVCSTGSCGFELPSCCFDAFHIWVVVNPNTAAALVTERTRKKRTMNNKQRWVRKLEVILFVCWVSVVVRLLCYIEYSTGKKKQKNCYCTEKVLFRTLFNHLVASKIWKNSYYFVIRWYANTDEAFLSLFDFRVFKDLLSIHRTLNVLQFGWKRTCKNRFEIFNTGCTIAPCAFRDLMPLLRNINVQSHETERTVGSLSPDFLTSSFPNRMWPLHETSTRWRAGAQLWCESSSASSR